MSRREEYAEELRSEAASLKHSWEKLFPNTPFALLVAGARPFTEFERMCRDYVDAAKIQFQRRS